MPQLSATPSDRSHALPASSSRNSSTLLADHKLPGYQCFEKEDLPQQLSPAARSKLLAVTCPPWLTANNPCWASRDLQLWFIFAPGGPCTSTAANARLWHCPLQVSQCVPMPLPCPCCCCCTRPHASLQLRSADLPLQPNRPSAARSAAKTYPSLLR